MLPIILVVSKNSLFTELQSGIMAKAIAMYNCKLNSSSQLATFQ